MKLVTALYYLGICIYELGVLVASLFDEKARLLRRGRKRTWEQLRSFNATGGTVWFHAASLGEFEQGRPLMEAIKKRRPNQKIVLTFYSPSGYEIRKDYQGADLVCYLPSDGPRNAQRFIEAVKPVAVYFIKYEFWHFFLTRIHRAEVPLYGVSMIFRPQQPFFTQFGDWFRDMLQQFTHIFVQDEASAKLLEGIGLTAHTVVGDTRFDRVAQIAQASAALPIVQSFAARDGHILVAGSTWPPDEQFIVPYVNRSDIDTRLIIAPHEIDDDRVAELLSSFTVPAARYSKLLAGAMDTAQVTNLKVLVVDVIGILSTIYRYGDVAYIGGGFGAGLHNSLEAAIYGRPVVVGPNNKKFREVQDLKACGAAFEVTNKEEFDGAMEQLTTSDAALTAASEAASRYCNGMLGATKKILEATLFKQ